MDVFEELSAEQKYAFYKYRKGENVFVTGQGGAGKSFLVRAIVQDLRLRAKYENEVVGTTATATAAPTTTSTYQRTVSMMNSRGASSSSSNGKPPPDTFAVTAMTGCAAILLQCGARTVHSWSGIGLGQGTVQDVVNKACKNPKATKAWRQTKVLIVDEVSMMSKRLFDILNRVGQAIRRNPARPFGGIQLIFIGDFFQLPPVSRAGDPEDTRLFCFQHPDWYRVFSPANHIYLRTVFRQRDPVFLRILEEVRQGQLGKESEQLLRGYVGREVAGAVSPTQLFTTNAKVDRVNQEMFGRIQAKEYLFSMQTTQDLRTYLDTGLSIEAHRVLECQQMTMDERQRAFDTFADAQNLMQTVSLKPGANVMCLFNLELELGIVNGSQGVVEGFVAAPMAANLRGSHPNPNKQGWSRGAFLVYDGPLYNEFGSNRTPQSHSKDSLDLSMFALDEGSVAVETPSPPKCVVQEMVQGGGDGNGETMMQVEEAPVEMDAQDQWYPVVRFVNGVRAVIRPLVYQIHDFPCLGVTQLPLRLSYAITIHKSQGLTLDMAMMDIGRSVFEYGQTYVALSRLRSLDGLYLTGFAPEKIKTDPAVLEFATRFETPDGSEDTLAQMHREVANDARYKKRQSAIAFSNSTTTTDGGKPNQNGEDLSSASTTKFSPNSLYNASSNKFVVVKRQNTASPP